LTGYPSIAALSPHLSGIEQMKNVTSLEPEKLAGWQASGGAKSLEDTSARGDQGDMQDYEISAALPTRVPSCFHP